MKCIGIIIGLCLAHQLYADGILIPLAPDYQVVSDVYSELVPEGKCLVTGQVKPTIDAGVGLENGTIATLDRSKATLTDAEGKYSLLISATDTALFFYKTPYKEIVIWKYPFRSQHKVTINFLPGYSQYYDQPNVLKPVIYLYSDEEIEARVRLSCKGQLTYTYPAYDSEWNVRVSANGITDQGTGKSYPYLFWEAQQEDLWFDVRNNTIEGFVIATDTLTDFLENSLTALGLNETEKTDFITFWAPRMLRQPYALVQFFIDDRYAERVAELSMIPTPDAMRRIYLVFAPLQSQHLPISISPQKFNGFERKGFTVVEWGGTEIDLRSSKKI